MRRGLIPLSDDEMTLEAQEPASGGDRVPSESKGGCEDFEVPFTQEGACWHEYDVGVKLVLARCNTVQYVCTNLAATNTKLIYQIPKDTYWFFWRKRQAQLCLLKTRKGSVLNETLFCTNKDHS